MPPAMVVSNRGPVSYRRDGSGTLVAHRGGGGLISGLAPVVADTDTIWLAAALSAEDRSAVASHQTDPRNRLIVLDPEMQRLAYEEVGNEVLWFLYHGLFELSRAPSFGREFTVAWEAFRAYNQAFADAIVEDAEPNAPILIQDYHLALLAPLVAQQRPDLALVHFSHTPFARPDWLAVLPAPLRRELMVAMTSFTACGFHCERWRVEFLASCVATGVTPPHTFVSPLGPDIEDLSATAATAPAKQAGDQLDALLGGRRSIIRVDRMELSKNILRGFRAFDELLDARPDLRERVCFSASLYPSRETLATYRAYHGEVRQAVDKVNDRWARGDWVPILLDTTDNFSRSIAALSRSDVLLVNPIRDGMNLVAKEGPLVNNRDGQLVLSTETGAWDEMGDASFGVHPFDVTATAVALAQALDLEQPERRHRAQRLREAAGARQPGDWFTDQLNAAQAGRRSSASRNSTT